MSAQSRRSRDVRALRVLVQGSTVQYLALPKPNGVVSGFDTEYNKEIAKQILNANEAYIKRSNLTGAGLSGGFIEHLSNALYEHSITCRR